MSRKLVIQLLVLAVVVGLGALGIGIWQERQNARQVASSPAGENSDASGATGTARSDAEEEKETTEADTSSAGTSSGDTPPSDDVSQASGSDVARDNAQASSTPSFDLMRVEPDGSAVVAGRAEAGSIVALLSNGKVVGKGIANASGEFAIVLDTPLDKGAHAVTLATQDKDGKTLGESRQSLAVSVPDDPATGEVLVMLNEPGAPSRVLQKPQALASASAPDEDKETGETSSADAGAGSAPDAGETRLAAADTRQDTAQSRDETSAADQTSSPTEQASTAPAGDSGSEQAGADTPAGANSAEQTAGSAGNTASGGTVAASAPADGTGEREIPGAPKASGSTTSDGTPSPSQALADATDQSVPGSSGNARVTVDAVETENDKVFVAGAGEPGSDVRVYLDNKLVGEARTDEKGRWLLEGESKVDPGQVDVRADQVRKDDGSVEARAQVTFEKAAPEAVVLRPLDATGSSDAGSGAHGASDTRQIPSVIIRTGDNLWTISQRRYGQGVRYTTIYQANKDQIRNPDLIYPGQVFMLPEGDRNWPAGN
jgi:nucleoid-associated protein YgaU